MQAFVYMEPEKQNLNQIKCQTLWIQPMNQTLNQISGLQIELKLWNEPNSLHFWATTVNSVAERTAYTFLSSPKYKVISIDIAGLASLFVHYVAPVSPYDIMVNSHSL